MTTNAKPFLKAIRNGPLTPAQIRAIRVRKQFSYKEAAERVGVTPRTWQSWELPSQKRIAPPWATLLIRLLEAGIV